LPCICGPSPNEGHSPKPSIKLTAGRSPASHPAAKPQRESQMTLQSPVLMMLISERRLVVLSCSP
jgi:hypothetical protein